MTLTEIGSNNADNIRDAIEERPLGVYLAIRTTFQNRDC